MKRGSFRTGEKPAIWLAIAMAATLHVIFLLLPVAVEKQFSQDRQRAIEIELTAVAAQETAALAPIPDPGLRPTISAPAPATSRPPVARPPEKLAASQPAEVTRPRPTAEAPQRAYQRDLAKMSEVEKKVLTSTLLARQYVTEESAADRLFGKPLAQDAGDIQKEFHFPLRKDLLEMLDQPLPDLPFEYTPGLVYFAYDPGWQGDLQRFWDVITPEFGWRTKYGTEVKCALILIIAGCVWK